MISATEDPLATYRPRVLSSTGVKRIVTRTFRDSALRARAIQPRAAPRVYDGAPDLSNEAIYQP